MISGWKDEIEKDYLGYLRKHPRVSPDEMAAHLKTSECSVVFWLTNLARDGKVRILAVEIVEGRRPPL